MHTDKRKFRRHAVRVMVAGALVTVPLGALAVTANAQAPTDEPVELETVTTEAPEGAEIHGDWRPRPGPDPRQTIIIPGPAEAMPAHPYPGGPRVEYREDHPEHGPTIHLHRPPTGSAGSS
ncbi:hypothetical protein ACFVMC_05865 [Nocardia sp. NPDC127579]|uniref:hypothetical protein n=1 Tax=Nocardia sp. NPDC127579 TaxID=3345402 RepID=UPI0036435682